MEVLTLYTFLHIIQKLVVDMSRNWYSKITLLSWQRNKYFSFNKSLYLCNAIEFVKVTFIRNQKYKFSPWSIIDENHSVFTECMLLGKHLNNLSQFNTRNLFIWAADWELTCDLDCKFPQEGVNDSHRISVTEAGDICTYLCFHGSENDFLNI